MIKVAAQVMVDGKFVTGESAGFKSPIEIKGDGIAVEVLSGAIVGSVILVIILAIVAFVIWKRRHPAYTQVVRLENGQGTFFALAFFIFQ